MVLCSSAAWFYSGYFPPKKAFSPIKGAKVIRLRTFLFIDYVMTLALGMLVPIPHRTANILTFKLFFLCSSLFAVHVSPSLHVNKSIFWLRPRFFLVVEGLKLTKEIVCAGGREWKAFFSSFFSVSTHKGEGKKQNFRSSEHEKLARSFLLAVYFRLERPTPPRRITRRIPRHCRVRQMFLPHGGEAEKFKLAEGFRSIVEQILTNFMLRLSFLPPFPLPWLLTLNTASESNEFFFHLQISQSHQARALSLGPFPENMKRAGNCWIMRWNDVTDFRLSECNYETAKRVLHP